MPRTCPPAAECESRTRSSLAGTQVRRTSSPAIWALVNRLPVALVIARVYRS